MTSLKCPFSKRMSVTAAASQDTQPAGLAGLQGGAGIEERLTAIL